jgi:3'-5' exoribonuclease
MLVKEVADGIDGFEAMMSLALQHMILSHHGTHEFGSPKLPKSIEAVILNKADDLDAQVSIFERAIAESDENGDDSFFTKRHYLLQRPIFKGLNRQNPDSQSNNDDADLDLFAVEPDSDPFAD